ncbi:MAG: PQQ-binding-like beta-propeller repeat protein [Thermoplasmata archaeon]|nr:PQQ-binding-like beta-propeller repeat protein [Thermoplasmata archaeon]
MDHWTWGHRSFPASLIVTAVLFCAISAIGPVKGDCDWTMFRYDHLHTGSVEGDVPGTNATAWTFDTNGTAWLVSSPMVVDGFVYIGCDDQRLYKLFEDNGTEVWNYSAGTGTYAGFWSSPCVDPDSGLVLCHANGVHAIDIETGELVWRFATMNREFCSPVVYGDRVYVGSYDEHLYCLPLEDPNGDGNISSGEVIWYYETGEYESGVRVEGTGGAVSTTPAIYGDMVLAAEQTQYNEQNQYCDYNLFCLPLDDPDGSGVIEHDEILWKYKIGEKVPIVETDIPGEGGDAFSSPTIDPALGQVYIGSRDEKMYCLDLDADDDGIDNDLDGFTDNEGALIWTFQSDNQIFSTASYHDGTLFFGTGYNSHASSGSFYAIPEEDPDGDGTITAVEMEWNFTSAEGMLSSALLADGKAIVGCNDGRLYVFDQKNGTILWTFETDADGEHAIGSSPSLYEGNLIFGCCNGRVYSLGEMASNAPPVISLLGPADGMRAPAGPELTWSASDEDEDDVLSFDVYLGTDEGEVAASSGDVMAVDDIGISSYVAEGLDGATRYFWKVVASDGDAEVASEIWEFTTNVAPTVALVSPGDDGTVDAGSVLLEWTASDDDDDTLTYDVMLARTDPPGPISEGRKDTTFEASVKEGRTYFWCIVADDGLDATRSATWSFRTSSGPQNEAPTIALRSPFDGATVDSLDVVLVYDGSDPDGDDVTYDVYLDTKDDPTYRIVAGSTAESCLADGLEDGATYRWKVVASDGELATASAVWGFTVQKPNSPPTIELSSPITNSVIGGTMVSLSWDAADVDGQELTFSIVMDTHPDPTLVVADGIEDLGYDISDLVRGETYHWKVIASDGIDETESSEWTFSVKAKDGGGDDPIPGPSAVEVVAVAIVSIGWYHGRKDT